MSDELITVVYFFLWAASEQALARMDTVGQTHSE